MLEDRRGALFERNAGKILLKLFLMKKTNFFYHMLIVLGLCGFMFCGNHNDNPSGNDVNSGGATGAPTDSNHVGDLRDPATSYPQPPVTGTAADSSRSKDSTRR
jgi:hypothetical protein